MIKLVIFDLDGTLVDSSKDIMVAANKTLEFYNGKSLDLKKIQGHIGEGFGPFMKHVAALHDGARAEDHGLLEMIFKKFQFFYDQQLIHHTAFYAGVENFIAKTLSGGVKIGVVSNKPEYQVRLILEGLGVSVKNLVEIYGGDTFEVKKPHPKPLEEMMTLAGVKPAETVMIGDSKADVQAARAAGTHFIGVTFGFNSTESLKAYGAEHFIDNFDALPGKIEIVIK